MAEEKEEPQKPLTREDVLKRIRKRGRRTEGFNLSGEEFEDGIDLSDLILRGIILNKAVLLSANFNGSDLSNAKFIGAKLERAKFNECKDKPFPTFAKLTGADFRGADLYEAEFIGAFLNNTNFRGAKLLNANFTIEGRRTPDLLFTDFRGADLFSSDFTGRSFHFTKLEGAYINWAKITEERTFLGDADWGNYIIGEEKPRKDFYSAEHRYRQLKEWYRKSGYYDIAAKFYYREKEANRKSLKLRSKHWNDRLVAESMRALFGYGERWWNIILWIAVVIFGLATAYYFWGSFSSSTFWDTLYYSATSFSALGYGNWAPQPTGWAKGMGATEAIIGVFMMALLLVTFVRKWTR